MLERKNVARLAEVPKGAGGCRRGEKMVKKLRIGLLFGGRSAEHEISLISARSIYQNLDSKKYSVTLIGISQDGRWYLQDDAKVLLGTKGMALKQFSPRGGELSVKPAPMSGKNLAVAGAKAGATPRIDVVFPVLHGPYGEDGTAQGLLELAGLPYVGADVLGSAVGMDKEVAKRLLRDAGLFVAGFRVLTRHEHGKSRSLAGKLAREVGYPLFVKPSRMGSSVGVSRVVAPGKLTGAIKKAFRFDDKLLLEKEIKGREIECAILGGDTPRASLIGEVIPGQDGFYSYRAKYVDESGVELVIPARLSAKQLSGAQQTALKAFCALNCYGMARVDMFLTGRGRIFVNELNTIPGFTSISMYPKLWELSGLPFPKLLDELIRLAIQRHKRKAKLRISR